MTWGDIFNKYKARGCDPSDAAYRADQWKKYYCLHRGHPDDLPSGGISRASMRMAEKIETFEGKQREMTDDDLANAAVDKIEELRRERNAAQDQCLDWERECNRLRKILDQHGINYAEQP